MHLDPVGNAVIEGAVLEGPRIEVGAELVVEHQQHVAVEFGGDALAVVVGRLDPRDLLAEVDAHEKPVAGSHRGPNPRQQADRGRRIEIADRAAKEGEQRRVGDPARQVELLRDVGDGRLDRQAGILAPELGGRLAQERGAHVDGHVHLAPGRWRASRPG